VSGTILDRIVATKETEVAAAKARAPLADWKDALGDMPPTRDFVTALRRGGEGPIRVIAEVKKASPSKGVIRADFDPVAIARAYQAGGASAISVLTDEQYFQGHLDYLEAVRAAVDLPLLRKDFTIDPYQVYEARRHGADAILLIAAILDDARITGLMESARSLGLGVLTEVHTEGEMERAVALGCPVIGINNRNLATFETDLGTTYRLGRSIPPGTVKVSESGIFTAAEAADLAAAGVDAILVGESLMRRDDVEKALRTLLGR